MTRRDIEVAAMALIGLIGVAGEWGIFVAMMVAALVGVPALVLLRLAELKAQRPTRRRSAK